MASWLRPAAALVLILALCAPPLTGDAQTRPGKIPRIGYVFARRAAEDQRVWDAARQGLRELGWDDGRNIALEVRWAEGRSERLPELVAELLRLNVDVLVAATTPGALAAKNATRTVPIVMLVVADPVGSGLVTSLARPGGNLTGLSLLSPELSGKRLALLKESLPGISRVAVLMNSGNRMHPVFWKETLVAARTLGLALQSIEVRAPEDFDAALRGAASGRAEALLVLDDPLFISYRSRLLGLAAAHRLPTMSGLREFAADGALLSYGPSFVDQYRRTAVYVDKILKGAKPADLPVEQPQKFELVVNRRTARALGALPPSSLLAQADEMIE